MFFLYAGNIEKYPFFPTFLEQKIWEYKTIISHLMFSSCFFLYAGGGGVEFCFGRKTILSHFTFYAIFNIKKYWKVPLHLLVKWKVVTPNSRAGQLESISIISSIPLFWFCISNVGVVWGGGGCNVFSHFMLFPTFLKKIWEYKTIISHLMFSGNIEKCPFTYSYWLNGRWFLQIVDIGNFIMRLEILKSAP